jgi:hypothetical protein
MISSLGYFPNSPALPAAQTFSIRISTSTPIDDTSALKAPNGDPNAPFGSVNATSLVFLQQGTTIAITFSRPGSSGGFFQQPDQPSPDETVPSYRIWVARIY